MSVFVCSNSECLTLDNTALAPGYWTSEGPPLCTACVMGKWHGEFERQRYDEQRDGPIVGKGRRLMFR